MSRDDLKGWISTLWPIVGGLILVGVAYATLGTRVSVAETTIDKHDRAINGTDGEDGIKTKLDRLYTIIDERLPKKPQ